MSIKADQPVTVRDLRAELIRVSLEHIERHGHETLSLRGMTKLLNVTTAAPYKHFPSRDHLLGAVAQEGFRAEHEAAVLAMARQQEPREQVAEVTDAFFDFALRRPALFRLLHETVLPEAVRAAGGVDFEQASYHLVERLCAALNPGEAEDSIKARLVAFWATVFGFTKIQIIGQLKPYMRGGLTAAQLQRAASQAAQSALAN